MSYEIGMAALNLEPTPRLAHTEYCSNDALKRAVTGLPDGHPDREAAFMRAWNVDLIWSTNDGPEPWEERGRVTDMGHSEFLEGGVDLRQPGTCPFASVEEALAFDAVAEYGLSDYEELVAYYERCYKEACRRHPDQVNMGGYYRTLMSGAIAIYGWDMLLQAAAQPERFARVLNSIYRQSLHHYRAWADTSIDVFMCHDDMVWSSGPFVRPDFYRAEIFPRYEALWDVLHQADKKVLYTSDGDFSTFVDDVVAAGADGLCFEPMTDLEPVVERYGGQVAIISSVVDARTLTFGSREEIRREVDETLALVKDVPGFVFAVGNHIPSNVPVDKARFYMQYLRDNWRTHSDGWLEVDIINM